MAIIAKRRREEEEEEEEEWRHATLETIDGFVVFFFLIFF